MSWLTFKRQKLQAIILACASIFISLEVKAVGAWETSIQNWESKVNAWISSPERGYLGLRVQANQLSSSDIFQSVRWNPANPAQFAVSNATSSGVELWQYNGLTATPESLDQDTPSGSQAAPILAWRPDGIRLAAGYTTDGTSGNVSFYNTYDSELDSVSASITGILAPRAIAWSPDGAFVAVAYGQYIAVYSYDDSVCTFICSLDYNSGAVVNSISWNPANSSTLLAVGYADAGGILCVDVLNYTESGTPQLQSTLSSPSQYSTDTGIHHHYYYHLWAVAWDPTGNYVAAAGSAANSQGVLYHYNAGTLTSVTPVDFGDNTHEFYDLSWNPVVNDDGSYSLAFAVHTQASGDGYVWFTWDGTSLVQRNSISDYESESALSTAWISNGTGFAISGESLIGSNNLIFNAAGSYASPALLRTTSNWINSNDGVLRTTSNAVNAFVSTSQITSSEVGSILNWISAPEKSYQGIQMQADTLSSGDLFQQIRCNPVDPTLFAVSNRTANSVQLWQYNGLTAQPTMIAQDASLESAPTLAWNNLGTRLAVGYGSSVNFYDASLVAQVATISVSDPVASLSWSRDGSMIAVAYGENVTAYSYADGEASEGSTYDSGANTTINSISWNPASDSSLIAVGYTYPSNGLYLDVIDNNNDLSSTLFEPILYTNSFSYPLAVAWDPTGTCIAIAGYKDNAQGTVYQYTPQIGEVLGTLTTTLESAIDFGRNPYGFYDLSWNHVANEDGTYSLLFDVDSSPSGDGYLWATWNGTSLTQQDTLSNLNVGSAYSAAWICDGSGFAITGQNMIGSGATNFVLNAATQPSIDSSLVRATSNAIANSSTAINQLSYATAALIRVKGGLWSSNYPKPQPRAGQPFMLPQPDQAFLDLPRELRSFLPTQMDGNNTIVEFVEDTTLDRDQEYTGNVTINGYGAKLNLAGHSISAVATKDTPSTLIIEAVELDNVDALALYADTVILRDVTLNLASGKMVNFSAGRVVVDGQLFITGSGVFVYTSNGLMTVNKNGSLIIDTGASFFYVPAGAQSDQLFHVDAGIEMVVLSAMPQGQPVVRGK